jgi:hypothetical protein
VEIPHSRPKSVLCSKILGRRWITWTSFGVEYANSGDDIVHAGGHSDAQDRNVEVGRTGSTSAMVLADVAEEEAVHDGVSGIDGEDANNVLIGRGERRAEYCNESLS